MAHRDRVGRVEQVGAVLRLEVPSEGRAHGAHLRCGQIVVRPVVGPLRAQPLGDGLRHGLRLRRRLAHLGVDQIEPAQHLAQEHQVQQAQLQRQPVPGHPPVEQREGRARRRAEQPVLQGLLRDEPQAQPVCAARVVRGLPRPVDIAERTEGVGRVPGVEGEILDAPGRRAGLGGAQVLAGDGQPGHRHRGRHGVLPLHGGVLDRRVPLVDVPLHAQLEDDVRLGEPPGDLTVQELRVAPVRGGRRRTAGRRAAADSAPDPPRPTGSRPGSSTSHWPGS